MGATSITEDKAAMELELENPLGLLVRNRAVTFYPQMSQMEFHRFLLRNDNLRIERDKHGYVTIHPIMTYDSSINEGEAFFALKLWSKQNPQLGKVLSPSASFDLPDGSTHKADGAWVSMKKHNQLSAEERKHIPLLIPDFVMEVRSQTDSIAKLRRKMLEVWMANGVEVAWLIDPLRGTAWVYRKGSEVEPFKKFEGILTVGELMPGFELDLKDLKND
jgi:Uma2 family endonuclease